MAVVHPRLEPWEYEAIMVDGGWTAPLEYVSDEVVVTPPTGMGHRTAHYAIAGAIRDWQRHTGDEGLATLDTFVRVGEDTMAPDVAYWAYARRPAFTWGRAEDPVPDLVVEIASPSTQVNDVGPKRASYLAAGVGEVWLVDGPGQTVTVATTAGDTVLAAGQRLVSAALPGFDALVGSLLA